VNIFDIVIVQPIFNLLLVIYSLIPGGDFGIALVVFTILVRLLMWPLIKKQLHQVKAMRKLQPELVKIKKASKGDKRAESLAMMELYKKHDVSPFRSIGILFIQLPIFIALFTVIQIFTKHLDQVAQFTYGFLQNLGPVQDLIANPGHFNQQMLGFLDLTKQAVVNFDFSTVNWVLLVLAIGAAVTQYIMSKQTMPNQPDKNKRRLRDIMNEAADGKKADQSEMNTAVMGKMTKFLPIMMFFIMISLPGALVLYYTVSNLVAVLQQKSILDKDATEMIQIADEPVKPAGKKATAKARARQAVEATTITRIVAKDTRSKR
jgi:YidC/Oxa1 family membrane protein insertase